MLFDLERTYKDGMESIICLFFAQRHQRVDARLAPAQQCSLPISHRCVIPIAGQ
jgi:hypothetical protein